MNFNHEMYQTKRGNARKFYQRNLIMLILCWHAYHDKLIAYVDPKAREITIKENKPKDEIEPRLFYFKSVKAELPKEFIKAGLAYAKTREAYKEVLEAYKEAGEAYEEAWKAYKEVGEAYAKTWEAYEEAYQRHKKEIEELHAKECPDCIWDGEKMDFTKWKK